MASQQAPLLALQKTQKAIKNIQKALQPYLKLLKTHQDAQNGTLTPTKSSSSTPTPTLAQVTEAQAAVALSIGTLRFMAARLKGQNRGKDKGDALRMELDKMRKTLVELRKLTPKTTTTGSAGKRKGVDGDGSVKKTKKEVKGKRKQMQESDESPVTKKRIKSPS